MTISQQPQEGNKSTKPTFPIFVIPEAILKAKYHELNWENKVSRKAGHYVPGLWVWTVLSLKFAS